jgi:hypothetical protein
MMDPLDLFEINDETPRPGHVPGPYVVPDLLDPDLHVTPLQA